MAFRKLDFIGSQKMRMNRESLTLPKDFADQIRQLEIPECFVTIGPQRLMLFPMSSWKTYSLRMQNSGNVEARRLLHTQRMFGSRPSVVDSSGRIKLPHQLYSFLKSPSEVYVIGMDTYIEIYTIEEYEKQIKKFREQEPFYPEDIL